MWRTPLASLLRPCAACRVCGPCLPRADAIDGCFSTLLPLPFAGTLAHYRNWSAQVQARYQMFNPEAIRPARRIYVGGLPNGTTEVCVCTDWL